MSEGKMEHEMDRWIGEAAAVTRVLYRTVDYGQCVKI